MVKKQVTYYQTDVKKVIEEGKRATRGGGLSGFFNPKVGPNEIRILPPWSDSGLPFKEVVVHFGIGPESQTVACLRPFRKRCYICEQVSKLWSSGLEQDQDTARRIGRANRYLWNIIDLQEPEKGVQILSCGVKLFEQIWAYFADEEWGDLTNPDSGYDLTIVREGLGLKTRYTSVRLRRNPTKLQNMEWLESLNDLDKALNVLSYDAQKELYEGYAEDEEVGIEEENVIERVEVAPKVSPPKVEEPGIGRVLEKTTLEKKCFGNFDPRLFAERECVKCPKLQDCMKAAQDNESDAREIERELKEGLK